ncbi:MAG: glycosyltransferase [Candidatus Omnitrophota bacterium]
MNKKRILLMYISDVSGHRSAAIAIEKAIRHLSGESEIKSINAFNYTNPIAEKIINRIYMSVIQKMPKIWEFLYDNQALIKKFENIKHAVNNSNSGKLKKLFDEFNPDVVVCTQAFPCGMVADFKKQYNSNITLVAVLTDYIPHSYWIYDTINYYISPSNEVTLRLVEKGVSQDKIRTLGIPFDHKFVKEINKKTVKDKLGLLPDVPVILIMGGGHGLGPMEGIVNSLEKSPANFQEIIVTGINKKLYSTLAKKVNKCRKKIILLGFVDNIHELMGIASLIITKPGGITVAEALTKKLPMIIVKPIPGQEANNTAYLMEKGAAIKVAEPKNINIAVEELLNNPEKAENMRRKAEQISKPHASLNIAELLLHLP